MQKYFGKKMIFNKYSGPKYLYVALSILFGLITEHLIWFNYFYLCLILYVLLLTALTGFGTILSQPDMFKVRATCKLKQAILW